MKNPRSSRWLAHALVLCALGAVSSASAALLVSESFSGYLGGSDINGQVALGTGLAGNWLSNVSGSPASSTAISAGLTFGAMSTSGGAVTVSVPGAPSSGVTARYLGLGVNTSASIGAVTGTLYSSFLYQTGTGYQPHNHAVHGRVSTAIDGLNANGRFFVNPDNSTGASAAAPYYAGSPPTINSGQAALTIGTTFLAIGKFTNVGSTGGIGTMLTLTETQYTDWLTNQGGDEAALFARSQGSGAGQVMVNLTTSVYAGTAVTFVGGTNTFIQTFTSSGNSASSTAFSVTYDEMRYATSFGELSLVPEPSGLALLAGSLSLFAFCRRRV